MSVYVDAMTPCLPNKNWNFHESCHLFADTEGELHRFADKIGLKRRWFQAGRLDHYDLSPRMRERAVTFGAIECDRQTVVDHMKTLGVAR